MILRLGSAPDHIAPCLPMPDASHNPDGDRPRPINSLEGLKRKLTDRTELEALEFLHRGDPLGLSNLSAEWMRKRCYFLDGSQLMLKAQLLVAGRIKRLDEAGDLETFLDGILEDAARLVLREEEGSALLDDVVPEPYEPRFVMLMENLAVDPDQLRRAVVTINSLPTGQRHVFHNCWVQGKGFGRYEQEFGVDAFRARELFLQAVDAVTTGIEGSDNHG
jgi:hypothetical protein